MVLFLSRRHEGLQRIIVFLAKWIQLVIVTSCTAHRDSHECRTDDVGPFSEHFIPAQSYIRISGISSDRSKTVKSGRNQFIVVRIFKLISGYLLPDELIERFIFIERPNDIITEPLGSR